MNIRSNRQEREDPSPPEARPWADLPVDVLGLVYDRLLPIHRIAFALACLSWHIYASSRPRPSFPLILPQLYWTSECRLRSPFHSNVYLPYQPPDYGHVRCRGAVGSWLLYYKIADRQPFFFVDPAFDNERVDLPPWQWTWRPLQDAIISAAPTDPDGCTVVFLYGKKIVYCKVGDRKWSSCAVRRYLDKSTGAFCGGTLHVIDECQRLGVVDFENVQNALTWLPMKLRQLNQGLSPPPIEYGRHFLMESSGTLLLVFLGQGGCWYVFRAHLTALTWRGVEDLEDRSLFLARAGSMPAVAVEAGVEPNRLYFARADTPQAPLATWISVAAHRRDNCWEENSCQRYIADVSLPIVASRWVFQRAVVVENETLP